jgi:hypothetical protein
MIGAIVLTHRDRRRSKSQVIAQQNARTPASTLAMIDVPIGVGVRAIDIRRPDAGRPDPALPAPDALTPVLHGEAPAPVSLSSARGDH